MGQDIVRLAVPVHYRRYQTGSHHPCRRSSSSHLAIEDEIASL